jgi:hypothetical protein
VKICIVGPGILPIPPRGWGAVEILIDDYRKSLQRLGHTVEIVNTKDMDLAAIIINHLNPDFVHIQYDEHIELAKKINCKKLAMTSHFGYLENRAKWHHDYKNFFIKACIAGINIFCLSEGIAQVYRDGCVSDKNLFVVKNGVRTDLFNFKEECPSPDASIYLAKIDERKRQIFFKDIENLWFAGRIADDRFPASHPRYIGELSKKQLYESLTDFSNLVLLSDGEAHPLVCMEALAAGLGIVVSECASANLDTSLPFIDIIPESKVYDIEYVSKVISENRSVSNKMRKEIREYGLTFDWESVVENIYLPAVNRVLNEA